MKSFLDYASKMYYEGTPVITDTEFDSLSDNSGYLHVGTDTQDGVKHLYRLYSLQKVYTGEKPIELQGKVVETPKLDGAAIALTYYAGRLIRILTRGDGKRGQDISHLIPVFKSIAPKTINSSLLIQVSGEIVADKSQPNSRNYAAGALNLKDQKEFSSRSLDFIAYDVKGVETESYSEAISLLDSLGFKTVMSKDLDRFPQDGRVFRVDSSYIYENLGYTSQFPKGAYALKVRQQGVVTKLLDVVWQVGRTGAVSPVAILKPVLVGDATIARATLHNMKYIEELNLEIGCHVEVVRAGEIIPRVVKRVQEK